MKVSSYLLLGGFSTMLIVFYITDGLPIDSDPIWAWIGGGGLLAVGIGAILGNAEQKDEETKQRERNIILTPKGSPVPKTNLQKFDDSMKYPRYILIAFIVFLIIYVLIEYVLF